MTQTITVEFKVEHTPGNELHLRFLAEKYLQEKGVVIKDGKIII